MENSSQQEVSLWSQAIGGLTFGLTMRDLGIALRYGNKLGIAPP